MKKRVETRGVVSDVAMSKKGRGEFIFLPYIINSLSLRPGADQSSKAAFDKSAFGKTCSNVLHFVQDMTGAYQSNKKQKYF